MADLSAVLSHFGTATSAWTSGNFDGAATIDLTDLSNVLNNFGRSTSTFFATSAAATPAPEPATAASLVLAALFLAKPGRSSARHR
jgi:hypothetical protein